MKTQKRWQLSELRVLLLRNCLIKIAPLIASTEAGRLLQSCDARGMNKMSNVWVVILGMLGMIQK